MLRQRGWYWTPRFDRWQVLAALLLAVLFILLTVRINRTPPAPVFSAPAPNAQLIAGSLGDAAGAARVNDTVRLFADDTALGDAKTGAGGQWRLPLTNLAPGPHTLLAKIVDANGKVLVTSQPLDITVLPAPTPAPAVVTPVISAPAPGAQLTAGSLGDLAGTGRPGDALRIFDGDREIGQATVGPDGAWRFPFPALASGAHRITARAVDANGSVLATSQPLDITILDAATPMPAVVTPVISAPAPGAQLTAGSLGDLAGTGRPGDALRIFDGDREIGQATVGPDGAWRFPFPALASGAHRITARAVDANGSVLATSQPLDITILDAATPTPVATAGGGTPGSGGTPGATPGSGGTPGATPGSGGTPGATPTPATGQVRAPVLTSALVSPLRTSRPLFRGTADPGVVVRIYDGDKLLGEVTADAAGNWSFIPATALAAGDHLLRLAAVDADSSEVFAEPLPFTIAADAQPLAPPTINLPPGGQLPAGERLTGTAPPDSTVTFYAGDKVLGAAVAGPDGTWQFVVPVDLAPGDYDFRAVAADAAGNFLGESLPVRIKILPPLGLPVTGGS